MYAIRTKIFGLTLMCLILAFMSLLAIGFYTRYSQLNNNSYWTHPKASLKIKHINGIDIVFKQELVANDFATVDGINTNGSKADQAFSTIETYSFLDSKSKEEVLYLELQPRETSKISDNSSNSNALTNSPESNTFPEPNNTDSGIDIKEGVYLGKLVGIEVYTISSDSEYFDMYKGVLLFKTGDGKLDVQGESGEYSYILGKTNQNTDRIRNILDRLQIMQSV